jgi:hypothetical protein
VCPLKVEVQQIVALAQTHQHAWGTLKLNALHMHAQAWCVSLCDVCVSLCNVCDPNHVSAWVSGGERAWGLPCYSAIGA